MTAGIYRIFNSVSGRYYIGRSINCEKRVRTHKSDLRKNKHFNNKLQKSWNLHGESTFEFSIIWVEDDENLVELEGFILEEMFDTGKLYNLHKSSDGGMKGMTFKQEWKDKQAKSRESSEAYKQHVKFLTSSENRARAISAAATPEARRKAVITRRTNGHKPFSDDVRKRQMDESKARVFSALDWAVANNESRGRALKKFSCSWGALKKYQPEWEAINGPLSLPKRASGERSGVFKHGLSKEFRRRKTPNELAASRKAKSVRMCGENNPMFGRKHTLEARAIQSAAAKRQATQRKDQK